MNDMVFIPIYITFLVKTLKKFNVAGSVEINYTLILRVPKIGVPEEILDSLKKKGFLIRFNESPVIVSPEDPQVVFKETTSCLIFNYRSSYTMEFFIKLSTTPFDRFGLKFRIELTSQAVNGTTSTHYRFNVHRNSVDFCSNLSFKPDCDQIHDFNIDYSANMMETKTEKKNDKTGSLDYEYVPAVEYTIGFYRQPEAILITLFFPIYILIFLVYLIFYQQSSMDSMLANLATVLLAVLAYQQVFRQIIPIQPNITFGDVQIILSIFSVLIVAVNSLMQEYYPETLISSRSKIIVLILLSVSNGGFLLLTLAFYIRYRIQKVYMDKKQVQPKRSGEDIEFRQWETCLIKTGSQNFEHSQLFDLTN